MSARLASLGGVEGGDREITGSIRTAEAVEARH